MVIAVIVIIMFCFEVAMISRVIKTMSGDIEMNFWNRFI